MTKNKITQKEAIFYTLYQAYNNNRGEYIPVFKFMGEIYCKELDLWGFVSHECSARCSEMRTDNPELIEHTVITGKSGATYYGYRINPLANVDMIKDKALLKFYNLICRK